MIASIEGILTAKRTTAIVVKSGMISFLVNVSGFTAGRLGNIGSEVMLFTYLYVREDNLSLYGFSTQVELNLFEQLITVSGIGPRVALNMLSALNAEQVASAIIGGNADLLSQVPGIGKKTAARIILDLKGKLQKGWQGEISPDIGQTDADAVAALTSLGYSVREATQALSGLPQDNAPLEEKVRLALQKLSRR